MLNLVLLLQIGNTLVVIGYVAVIEIVELNLGFPIVQFLSKNIDVSKSYGRNATENELTNRISYSLVR